MKYAGLICILLAACTAGYAAASGLRAKAEQARLLHLLLERICGELRASLPLITDLIRNLAGQADFSGLHFLTRAAERAEQFPECWQTALSEDRTLPPDVRRVLEQTGSILGSMPLEEQISALRVQQTRLAELTAQYSDTERQKGTLYRSLGILSGLFFVIILL